MLLARRVKNSAAPNPELDFSCHYPLGWDNFTLLPEQGVWDVEFVGNSRFANLYFGVGANKYVRADNISCTACEYRDAEFRKYSDISV
jgi:hypothetical protein